MKYKSSVEGSGEFNFGLNPFGGGEVADESELAKLKATHRKLLTALNSGRIVLPKTIEVLEPLNIFRRTGRNLTRKNTPADPVFSGKEYADGLHGKYHVVGTAPGVDVTFREWIQAVDKKGFDASYSQTYKFAVDVAGNVWERRFKSPTDTNTIGVVFDENHRFEECGLLIPAIEGRMRRELSLNKIEA